MEFFLQTMEKITKEQFARGSLWKLLERFTGRGIALLVSIILSRILSADDYGLLALTTVFTNLSEILIDAGFSTALIRKQDVDEEDFACVFTISAFISTILYCILFIIAPFIADFYLKPELKNVLRIMGLVLFIQAFSSTRNAYVNRNMQFKLLMKCNTVAAILSGIIGIVLAYCGFGVWTLVFQRLLQQTILTLLLFAKIRWKPKLRFNKNKFHELFGFSAGVIGASLVNYVENCVNSLVVGKHYSIADLGYMDKANILPEQISLNSFGAMTNVLLPTVSSYQNDIERLKEVIRKVVRYTAFLLFPIMLGILAVSREAIIILFTEKWLPSVPLMQFICIYYIATPLMLIDVQVFFGLGHSKIRLKTEIYRMIFIILGVIICCFAFNFEIRYLAMANAIAVSLGTLITHFEVKKLIDYTFLDRFKDTYKSIFSAIIMCVVILLSNLVFMKISIPIIVVFLLKIIMGIIIYILLSLLLKNSVFFELMCLLKKKQKKS